MALEQIVRVANTCHIETVEGEITIFYKRAESGQKLLAPYGKMS